MNTNQSKAGPPPLSAEAADGHIQLRVTMDRKNHYVRFAQKRGQNLREMMFEAADKLSGYADKNTK